MIAEEIVTHSIRAALVIDQCRPVCFDRWQVVYRRVPRDGGAVIIDRTTVVLGVDEAMSDEIDRLYHEGIKHFNECDFFEAHEIWEELWTDYRGESRKFYQGLIQAAVALYHFGNGNIRGARKLHRSSSDYLRPYGPKHLGLNVEKFLREFDRCFALVASSTEEFPQIEIDAELIPEIHLESPA